MNSYFSSDRIYLKNDIMILFFIPFSFLKMGNVSARIQRGLIEFNLFKSGLNQPDILQRERLSTRLYLLLISVALITLILYTAFGTETIHVVIHDPTLETYETLYSKYVETLKCPCSQIAVKYSQFIDIVPIYHQVCSSSFVTDEWIEASYRKNGSYLWPMDVRTTISAHAQFLRAFCTNTQRGISFVLNEILPTPLVSAEVLPESLVEIQVKITEKSIQSAGQWQISVLITFVQLTMSSSSIMTGLGTNAFLYIPSNDSSSASVSVNSYQQNNNSPPCYCLTTSNCPIAGALYPTEQMPTFGQYNLDIVQNGSTPIKGIQTGCFGIESVLGSTLECYYDRNCYGLFVSNPERFTPLISNANDTFASDTTINDLLNVLMVDKWSVNMSYPNYYSTCAPKTCSYSYNQRNQFFIILTSIIALIGGLNSILRLIVPVLIQLIYELKTRRDSHRQPTDNSLTSKLTWIWLKLRMLNLFNSHSNNFLKQKRERQTTRLYIISITISFIILLTYTVLSEETKVYTISHPTQDVYDKLYASHSNTIECTCEQISIAYSTFTDIQAEYHQVCSSQFISPGFFIQLAYFRTDTPLYPGDFTLIGTGYFQWLTTFCILSRLVFDNQFIEFKGKLLVNNKLLSRDAFDNQANQIVNSFTSDVQYYFARGMKETREILGFTQPISATSSITYSLPIEHTNNVSQVRLLPQKFFSGCSCLSSPTSCSNQAAFYSYQPLTNSFISSFNVSGVRIACSPIETLLQSSLDCWYSAQCYQTVIQYWQNRTYGVSFLPPLLNKSQTGDYEPSTPLYKILDNLMVENWSTSVSYDSYFKQCAPSYCIYSITQRRDIVLIVTILLGLFGGLNIALKILIPFVIRLVNWLVRHGKSFPRLRQLNLFYHQHRSTEATLQLELYSTRLYILLLLLSMSILLSYYSLVQTLITVTIQSPNQQTYERMRQRKDISSIQCPCSQVSFPYGRFVNAETSLHDICSSSFIDNQWIDAILGDGDWSSIEFNEFTGRGLVYFQGLQSLCYLFQENVTQYLAHFRASSFISSQVLSQIELFSQVTDVIEQVKVTRRSDHTAMYNFARDLESANQMLTIYSTNWMYAPIHYDSHRVGLPVPLIPMSHGNCSCATSSKCIQPVYLKEQLIPGFVLGCLPFESLFQSTLVCLYNRTCINQINLGNLTVRPLIPPSNRTLSINRTIEELINSAFDMDWSVNISYSRFFQECKPASCSYSYNYRRNFAQIIVTLLGFYGGLTVTLRTLVPYMIQFVHRIIRKCKRMHSHQIHPQNENKF